MRYLALCCDYDGTLAHDGVVGPETRAALERCRASGRRLLLVTGRELPELKQVCSCLELFACVVAENGALLYRPDSGEETPLAAAPPSHFVRELAERGVGPISVGRVIVATWEPHETTVLQSIRDLGLDLQVIFNKGAVMILPSGVNKATGLAAALSVLGLSAHNAVAIGDAENDQAFLAACECGVAVANALPALKQSADFVTRAGHGAGVSELIEELIASDLADREPLLQRHRILLGHDLRGRPVTVPPYGTRVLMSGSGSGRLAGSFLAHLAEQRYSYCVVDPQAELVALPGAVMLGTLERPPSLEEVLKLLARTDQNAAVNVSGIPRGERPRFLRQLLPHLESQRSRSARPHWLVLNEAHELWDTHPAPPPRTLLQISSRASELTSSQLRDADLFIACGEDAPASLLGLGRRMGAEVEQWQVKASTHALVWRRAGGEPPEPLRPAPPPSASAAQLALGARTGAAPEAPAG